ncbi:MAG: radical SAM protein [Acidobacteriaceae bacterium]|nr:radical SAM protein [Acidobacteriaceae bacterium]
MYLIEIYKSVQGESSHAGRPCIFVRLAGCNLRCSWCDSEYTFTGGYKLSEDEVVSEIVRLAPVKLVEFTGGEPLLQERELIPLMERLLAEGYELMIETSGERPVDKVPKAVYKIVDVKCPGSGESGRFRIPNLALLTERDELKFVVKNRDDYVYARDFIRTNALERRGPQLLLSPAFSKTPTLERTTTNCMLDPRELVEWMLADGVDARLSLQIHKYVWAPQKRGV